MFDLRDVVFILWAILGMADIVGIMSADMVEWLSLFAGHDDFDILG